MIFHSFLYVDQAGLKKKSISKLRSSSSTLRLHHFGAPSPTCAFPCSTPLPAPCARWHWACSPHHAQSDLGHGWPLGATKTGSFKPPMDGHLMPFVIVIIIDHPALPRVRFVSPFGNMMIKHPFGAQKPHSSPLCLPLSIHTKLLPTFSAWENQQPNKNSTQTQWTKLSLIQHKNRLVTKHLT